jgi:predicted DNA-binding transcriptional regulator AlpA
MNSNSPNLVSVRYLAARLGVNVRTVWRLMAGDRNFPRPVKVGRCTRFALSEVESYVQALLARRKTV